VTGDDTGEKFGVLALESDEAEGVCGEEGADEYGDPMGDRAGVGGDF
jgi:hypothetical protein